MSDLHCASDSTTASVGQWIAPNGVDLTNSSTDPFDVIVGGVQDPGSFIVQLRHGHIVSSGFQGVYTCVLPREDGEQVYLRVGILPNGFNSMFIRSWKITLFY